MKSIRTRLLGSVALSLALSIGVPSATTFAQDGAASVELIQQRIADLEAKLEETRATGGDVSEIEGLLDRSRALLEAARQAEAGQAPAEVEAEASVEAEAPVDETLSEQAAPAVEEQPAADAAPVEETAPVVEEAAPAETPVEEPVTAQEPAPVDTPVATDEAPVEEEQPSQQAEEAAPAEDPAGDEPMTIQAAPTPEPAPDAAESAREPSEEELRPERQQAEQPVEEAPVEAQQAEQPAEEAPVEAQQAQEPAQPQEPSEATAEQPAQEAAPAQQAAPTQQQPAERLYSEEELRQAQQQAAATAELEARRREAAKSEAERRKDRNERLKIFGSAAAGAAVGAIIPQIGGRLIEQQGDRAIIQRGDQYIVYSDETERFREDGSVVRTEQLADGRSRTTVTRPNGIEVVTLRDDAGFIIKRTRYLPNGDEVVLIDNTFVPEEYLVAEAPLVFEEELPPLRLTIPREEYIVETRQATPQQIETAFLAPPVEEVERAYTLREVRESERLREKVRRVDLDTITFDTGSAQVSLNQAATLEEIGETLNSIIEANPDEVFLVEGHTDAVGSDLFNLTLSDRRAESVAVLLSDLYDVAPENLVTQGYGEQYLKVPTLGPERENRRVTIRRITPLLRAAQN